MIEKAAFTAAFCIRGGMKVEGWLPIVTDLGFPIAVTFYLLHRIEGKLDVLIETLHQFSGRT